MCLIINNSYKTSLSVKQFCQVILMQVNGMKMPLLIECLSQIRAQHHDTNHSMFNIMLRMLAIVASCLMLEWKSHIKDIIIMSNNFVGFAYAPMKTISREEAERIHGDKVST